MVDLTLKDAQHRFSELVDNIAERHQVYNVHSNKGDIVLLSKNEYDSLVETIKLLSIPGFRESLKKSVEQMNRGDTFAFEEIFGGE